MSLDADYRIPRYLDRPKRVLFLTVDEWLLAFFVLFVGWGGLDEAMFSLCVAALLVYGMKRVKAVHGDYFLWVWVYWYLPPWWTFKVIPPSYARVFIG